MSAAAPREDGAGGVSSGRMQLDDTQAATAGSARTLAAVETVATDVEDWPRGAAFGRYVLLERLGSGGMGVVLAAYDPELDRRVALKLLHGGDDETGRMWLLREAQALARLAHPNVVAVHDVGTHERRVWVAMEFVAGRTLGAWARERPRRWPEILRALIDVGRGVAAAHAVGLVHRDLKPDNVMVGDDGRVRVMDFGLAHGRVAATTAPEGAGGSDESRPVLAALALHLSRTGTLQGTPRYMAPEQWEGREADPAADQFAWSVMAWELLFGAPPFAGDDLATLAHAVTSGARRPAPWGRVPGWLRRVVERGLATEPGRRWPSMPALLAALARGRVRARVRVAALVVVGIAAVVAGIAAERRWDLAARVAACDEAGAEIAAVWNDEARADLRRALVATGVPYAETAASRVVPWIDQHAAAWRQARTDACLDASVRGSWTADTAERAAWCLEERRLGLESLLAEFAAADARTVQKAVTAAASLGLVAACRDPVLLQREPLPPIELRPQVRELHAELARAATLRLLGGHGEGLKIAVRARERAARDVGWRPLVAAAYYLEGRLLHATGAYTEAEAALLAAYREAGLVGAWSVAADAAVAAIRVVGHELARPADGRAWALHAEIAAAHAGDPGGLREANRRNALAIVDLDVGDHGAARAGHERALAILESAFGVDHPAVASSLGNLALVHESAGDLVAARGLQERVLAVQEAVLGPGHPAVALVRNNLAMTLEQLGDHTRARALHEQALADLRRALGPDHPDVALSLDNLALARAGVGAHAEARALHAEALAIREKALGPEHPDVAISLSNLGNAEEELGELVAARDHHARALAILERTRGPDHADVAVVLGNLAAVQKALGAHAEAQALRERVLVIREKALGPDHPEVALALYNLAAAHRLAGREAEARSLYQRALGIQERALGAEHPVVARTLVGLARLDLERGRPREARALLERSVAIYGAHPGAQDYEFAAHFDLAEALLPEDPARAVAEAEAARDGYRSAGAARAAELAAVEAWLARHRR